MLKLDQLNLAPHNVWMDTGERLLNAIKAKDARRVRQAIEAGAKLTSSDGQRSPLHAAAEGGDVEVLGALPRAQVRKFLDECDASDRTPLMCAAAKGNVEAARALLAMGADVNTRNSLGDTALRAAAAEGTPEMARLLLEAGADPLAPGRLMLTPLDRARERRTPEGRMITAILIRHLEAKSAAKAGRRGAKRPRAQRRARISRKLRKARKLGRRGVK